MRCIPHFSLCDWCKPMIKSMLKPFVFACLLLAANTCFAQLTTHSTFTLYPIGGKVVQVNPRGVIMSHKGKKVLFR